MDVLCAGADKAVNLTDRQKQILELVADGRTNAQIASGLHLSERTVKWHISELSARLGISSRIHLGMLVLLVHLQNCPEGQWW